MRRFDPVMPGYVTFALFEYKTDRTFTHVAAVWADDICIAASVHLVFDIINFIKNHCLFFREISPLDKHFGLIS